MTVSVFSDHCTDRGLLDLLTTGSSVTVSVLLDLCLSDHCLSNSFLLAILAARLSSAVWRESEEEEEESDSGDGSRSRIGSLEISTTTKDDFLLEEEEDEEEEEDILDLRYSAMPTLALLESLLSVLKIKFMKIGRLLPAS